MYVNKNDIFKLLPFLSEDEKAGILDAIDIAIFTSLDNKNNVDVQALTNHVLNFVEATNTIRKAFDL